MYTHQLHRSPLPQLLRRLLLIVLLLVVSVQAHSIPAETCREQSSTLRGVVVGLMTRERIANATVCLISAQGSIVASVPTSTDGTFELRAPIGSYTLRVTHVCYFPYTQAQQVVSADDMGIVHIAMEERDELLEEIVVTSTRTAKHLMDVTVPTTVVGKADIQRVVPNSVVELLEYALPGVEFSTHANIPKISMQGLSGHYVTILLNGEEMAGMKQGNIDFFRIDPSSIERIEVVKGAGSALYGSNSIAGVINIITRQPSEPLRGDLSVGYNSTGQWDATLTGAIRRAQWSNSSTIAVRRQGGFYLQSSGTDGRQIPANDIWSGQTRWGYTPSEKFRASMELQGSRRLQRLSPERHDRYLSMGGSGRASYRLSTESDIELSYATDLSLRHRIYPKIASSDPEKMELMHHNLKQIARLQWNYSLDNGQELNIGGEAKEERLLSDQIAGAQDNKRIWNTVLYGQYLLPILPSLELLTGLRIDYHSRSRWHASPKVNIAYRRPNLTLRAAYAHAFKSPEIMELYYDWSHMGMFHIYGNPDLRPETAHQWMMSLDYSRSRLQVTADYTYTDFRDRIVMLSDEKGDQRHYNIDGKSHMNVANLRLTWKPFNGISLSTGYTYIYSPTQIVHHGSSYTFNNRRPHNLLGTIQWHMEMGTWRISTSAMARYFAPTRGYYIEESTEESEPVSSAPIASNTTLQRYEYEGYTTTRITASVTYKQQYTLSIGADNLLDFRPQNIVMFNTNLVTPRNYFAKLTLSIP